MLRAGALLAAALLMAMPSFAQSNAPAGPAANSLNIPSTLGIELNCKPIWTPPGTSQETSWRRKPSEI